MKSQSATAKIHSLVPKTEDLLRDVATRFATPIGPRRFLYVEGGVGNFNANDPRSVVDAVQ